VASLVLAIVLAPEWPSGRYFLPLVATVTWKVAAALFLRHAVEAAIDFVDLAIERRLPR
jgi:hypothetical protein